MHRVGFVYDDVFLKHENPPWHPERKERLTSIVRALENSDLRGSLTRIKPRRASLEEIQYVHTRRYVEKLMGFRGYADPDTYVSEGSFEAALYAAGAVMEAVDRVKSGEIERAFCAVRPPGHHAEADRAMGFCLFNNVAVGARYAQRNGFRKVFIVDFDVHHGNGTQYAFEEDDTVFYFSTHQYPHYPGTGSRDEKGRGKGAGATANHPLPSGSGENEYFPLYHDLLPALVRDFDPDIVLVSAGYDLLAGDPLSAMRIGDEGMRNIVRGILSGKPVPAVFSLEGGYDLEALAGAVLLTIGELLYFPS